MSRTTIAIPTYNRGEILVKTVEHLVRLAHPAESILLVDQTLEHTHQVHERLQAWATAGTVQWIRLSEPSVPKAMNVALRTATSDLVLFLDDDIVPGANLVQAHEHAHREDVWAVAGQVLQPGQMEHHFTILHEGVLPDLEFPFNHDASCDIENVMAGNLSVDRSRALSIGGFDENFIGAAYRFETDFARRVIAAGGRIRYEPAATLHHLHLATGGIRAHGDHRSSPKPSHSAGDYYFALWNIPAPRAYAAHRLLKNVCTRWHLAHPWAIPLKLVAELRGFLLARRLHRQGRRLAE
jgi:GT2 family glycosyltransferase